MPLEIMDQRGNAPPSHFFEDVCLLAERKSGFLKLNPTPDNHHLVGTDIMAPIPGSKAFALSPFEKPSPTGALLLNDARSSHLGTARDEKEKPPIAEENSNMSMKPLNSTDHLRNSRSAFLNGGLGRVRDGITGSQWESSLFSSSFSDVFNRNLRLSSNDILPQQVVQKVGNLCEEEEPFEALEEIEAKTIGNLLPSEDDLFSGVTDELGCNGHGRGGDGLEDIDLFSSVGSMEMEGDDHLIRNPNNSYPGGVSPAQGSSNFLVAKAHWCNELSSNHDARAIKAALSSFNNGDLAGQSINLDQNFVVSGQSSVQQLKLEKGKHGLVEGLFSNLSSTQIAGCVDNGTSPILPSTIQVPIGAFAEPSHSTDTMKRINQFIPIFQHHSFPQYHNSLANGFPYNSSNTIGGIGSSVGSNTIRGFNNSHIRVGNPMDINEGGFGSSGNGDCLLHGHHYMWNNSNSDRQHPSSHMIWPNSPSFGNNINLSHMSGFSRPTIINTTPANHHVGSALTNNPSQWDRQHAYPGDTSETPSFCLGSLGSVEFLRSSPSHPMEMATRNVFPHVGGNFVDMTKSAGVGSPQRLCHGFPGRNPVISVPTSFDSHNDRMRCFSHHKIDSNSSPEDKKQYELDIDRILHLEDCRTTLMIKNIPNKYTSKMLLAAIDEQCRGTYDFIYLPIDFKNKCNVGYAFINMVDAQRIIPFYQAFNGKKWEKFNSEKVAILAYARIQGKAALVSHFQNSSLMNEDKHCRPILFHTDGPNAGDPEPFPMGSHVPPRPSKSRLSNNEENHRCSNPSTVVNAEDSGNGTDSSSGSD